MIFGPRKHDKEVSKQIDEYCLLIKETVSEFRRMIAEYISWDAHFKQQSKKVHKMEHEADNLRRSIERAMFEGAFLPAYREDYINLLEALDRVANKAEDAADTLYLVRPDIPDEIRAVFVQIAELTEEAFEPIPEAISKLMQGETDIQQLELYVEEKEQEVDKIQFHLTRRIFKELNIDKADRLCLKMLIDQICDVSDKIENVTDVMSIVAIKRSFV